MKTKNLNPQLSHPIRRSILETDAVSKKLAEGTGVLASSFVLTDCQLVDRNNWWYRCTYFHNPEPRWQPLRRFGEDGNRYYRSY